VKNGIVDAWRQMRGATHLAMFGPGLVIALLGSACGGRTGLDMAGSSPLGEKAGSGGAPSSVAWDRIIWDAPLDENVVYLWTGSEKNTWAVVSGGADFSRDHWDGSGWARTRAEQDPRGGFGDGQIWATQSGRAFAGSGKNLQRWPGTTWSDWRNTPGCQAIGGTAEDDIWCATESELWRFDGARWTHQGMSGIRGILASTRADVWVWGVQGASHFDGVRWSLERTNLVRRVSASTPTDVWALQDGDLLHSAGPGTTWTRQNPTGSQISGLWSQAQTNTWLVAAGAAMRWNGSNWETVALPVQDEWLLISGSSADLWLAGTLRLLHGHPARK